MRHILTLLDLTTEEIRRILAIAVELKSRLELGDRPPILERRVAGLLFEKPSLRTRVSFESLMAQTGGASLFLGSDVGWGTREPMRDFVPILSSYLDVLVFRAKSHQQVVAATEFSRCPIINGLTDVAHPCQALADLMTVSELENGLDKARIAYLGDGNNVAYSLAVICSRLGVPLTIGAPQKYQFDANFIQQLNKQAGTELIHQTDDPMLAVSDASIIYTDVWTSMGQEAESKQRVSELAKFQVNAKLVSAARANAKFLHCLPARRGEEVTTEIIDGPHSAIIQQANNRLHAQKGLVVWLLTEADNSAGRRQETLSMSAHEAISRIYLDNAATSWPKPESVYAASERAQRQLGAGAGRGAYRQANEVSRVIDQTRSAIAQLINAKHSRNVAFTFNCTDSLCTAIFGILRTGDGVVTSTAEHNSVLRPLRHLEHQKKIQIKCVDCDPAGQLDANKIIQAIDSETRLVILSHVSNVTGAIQPVVAIGKHCREKGILFLIDAAQLIGHLPIDVATLNCDVLAAAGHKGLLGPLGTGFLYYTDAVAEQLTPLRFGGTGSTKNSDEQPVQWPEKFEAGNLNVPGICGLGAGIEFLNSSAGRERQEIAAENKIILLRGLQQLSGVRLHGPTIPDERLGVFSISIADLNCQDAAAALDANWSIQTRAGFHCAPLLHRSIGTEALGGTLRISLGSFNTTDEIHQTLDALHELSGS